MKLVSVGRERSGSKIILAGDIGGTKTRLGLYHVTDDHRHRLMHGKTFPSKKYRGLEMILQEFIGGGKNIDSFCLGVAGPIIKGRVKLTNLPWVIDTKTLFKELKVKKVVMINDLVANAYGISMLRKSDFVTLNIGKERKGNAALVSAETGLGEAILFRNGKKYLPSPSEGGHVEFGPRNKFEIELLQYLLKRFNHVSYERVVSGEGLFHIYQYLRDSKRFGSEPKWLIKRMEQQDPVAVISQAAGDQKNRLCMAALDMFSSIYGAEARTRASDAGVTERCEFECSDLRDLLSMTGRFDLVLYIGLGRLLGPLDETVARLRTLVRRGGFLVMDDAFLAVPTPTSSVRVEGYRSYQEARQAIAVHGDTLPEEVVFSPEAIRAANQRNTEQIRRRAEILARHLPEQAFVSVRKDTIHPQG